MMDTVDAAVLYLRSATTGSGDSTAAQRAALLREAAAKNLVVVAAYEDVGGAGLAAKNRLQLRNLLRDAEAGAFRHVLVRDLARFSRGMGRCLSWVEKLRAAGVTVHAGEATLRPE